MEEVTHNYTKEQIEEIAQGITVIKFDRDAKAKDFVIFEYPKVDLFHQSCIWDKPSCSYDHLREVKQVFPSFEATHSYGHGSLFKPTLAEIIQAMPTELIGKVNAVGIRYNGFTEDRSKHKSIITSYLIGEKRAKLVPPVDPETEQKIHPSSLTIRDLAGTVLDEFVHVSIDVVIPDYNNLQSVWDGPLNNVPEEYLSRGFRPIELLKDLGDCIHLIVN